MSTYSPGYAALSVFVLPTYHETDKTMEMVQDVVIQTFQYAWHKFGVLGIMGILVLVGLLARIWFYCYNLLKYGR